MIETLYKVPIYICDDLISEEYLEKLEKIVLKTSEEIPDYGDQWNPDVKKFSIKHTTWENHPDFQPLIDLMTNEMKKFLIGCGYSESQCEDLFIMNIWSGAYTETDSLSMHIHRTAHWSSSFYIKNKTPTKLKFIHRWNDQMPFPEDKDNEWSTNHTFLECKPNRFVAWQSDITHGVNRIIRPEGVDDEYLKVMLSINWKFKDRYKCFSPSITSQNGTSET